MTHKALGFNWALRIAGLLLPLWPRSAHAFAGTDQKAQAAGFVILFVGLPLFIFVVAGLPAIHNAMIGYMASIVATIYAYFRQQR